jgi:serine/threonine-protein kinase
MTDIGKTISHYKILEKLGEGGMGVVYKAEDTRLKRTVALKFLPPELTKHPEAKERFIHEAQAASSLQHTNICNIHEIDQTDDGQIFICMDCYEGETLSAKIKRRPLKLEDAINIATQIANGLATAHEAGIVHRDIKPANIIVTEKDDVKILDFGLAKLAGSTKLTRSGTTIGTAAYMSPEQLKADKIDHRTDIWALGVVMYEMLTGQVPFKGDYEQAISYAILNEEPEPITALRTGIPMSLEWVVNKAIAKEPKQRYQHVDEIPVDLANIETKPSGVSTTSAYTTVSPQKPESLRSKRFLDWRVIGPILGLIVGATLWEWIEPSASLEIAHRPVIRFELSTLPAHRLSIRSGGSIAISPECNQLAYVGVHDQGRQLYLKAMDQLEGSKPIPGSENARSPFFSPDGRWLGFQADDHLKKVAVAGGRPITICEASWGWLGASWGSNDVIVFPQAHGEKTNSGLMKVSAAGGAPEVVTTPAEVDEGQHRHRWPSVLPGGDMALCTIWNGVLEEARIGVANLKSGEVKELTVKGTFPQYTETGHIVYAQAGGSLFAAPFDLGRLAVTGSPTPLIFEVDIATSGQAKFALSGNGTLVYIPAPSSKSSMVIVDRHGTEQLLVEERRAFGRPSFSPDGRRVAVDIREADNRDIWVYDLESGTRSRLTSEGINFYPFWTPDGERVTFSSNREGTIDVFWVPADGSGPLEPLVVADYDQYGSSWTPDGKRLFFVKNHPETGFDIWTVLLNGDSTTRPFLVTSFHEYFTSVCPDGKWLAHLSDESGRFEVYVRALDGTGGRYPISRSGVAAKPIWAASGRELFYATAEGLFSATVETDSVFRVVERQVLFELHQYSSGDVHPDGDRFLVIKEDETSAQMVVVVNWFEELKRKVITND